MGINVYLILTFSFIVSSLASLDCDTNACNDLEAAKTCKKVRYCIDNVWVKQKPTGQSDSVCDICLRMVKEARDTLRSNETQEELRQVFEGSCKLLVLSPLKKTCDKLVDEFVPELVEILSSQMDPETVCTVSKLCNNDAARFYDLHSTNCYHCQKFVRSALDNMTSTTPEIFRQKLLYKCRSQGSFSDACSFYVTAYSDFIYGQTLQALKKNPCEASHLCPTDSADQVQLPPLIKPRTDMCSLCMASTKAVKKEMLRVKSSEDFKEVVLNTCKGLGLFQKGCEDLAEIPAKKMHYMFKEKFNPKVICDFSYCTLPETEVPVWPLLPASTELTKSEEPINFMNLLENFESFIPDEEEEEKEKRVSISVGDPIETPFVIGPISLLSNNNDNVKDCSNCRNMFEALRRNVDADDGYIKNVFTSVCNETENFKKCQMFLNLFTPSLKNLFKSHLTSEKMCPELVSSCAGEMPGSESKDFLEGSCAFCKKTFQSLRSGFDADGSRAKLGEYFLKLCDEVPLISLRTCKDFISVFVNKTLPKVATEYSEDETCNYLELCRNPSESVAGEPEVTVVVEENPLSVKNEGCEICMMVLQTLIDQLKNKESEDDIRKALNSICKLVPSQFKQKCHQIVNNYADQIVEMILDNLSPAEICAELNFCNKAQQSLLTIPLLPGLPIGPTSTTAGDKGPCRICLLIMKMLIDQLQNDKTEDAIRKALNGVCKYFPEETRDTCKNLIGEYTEDVIDMIIADFNETEICIFLKLCGPKQASELSWYKNPRPVFKTFDIATNEVRETNSPEEICNRCKKLESSLRVLSNKNKTEETMLEFLVGTCIRDGSEKYAKCAEMVLKDLQPEGPIAFFDKKDICSRFEVCPKESENKIGERGLAILHSAVQECAMCEALVEVISTHKKMLRKDYDFAGNASHICSIVPRRNTKRCVSMLISYGPSIVNLILDQHVEPDNVCYHLTLCDDTMQAKVRMPVSASESNNDNDCLKGPSFWCANEENSKKCGTYLHCRELVWTNGEPPQ